MMLFVEIKCSVCLSSVSEHNSLMDGEMEWKVQGDSL